MTKVAAATPTPGRSTEADTRHVAAAPVSESRARYVLVQLVLQEAFEELIEAQALEPMIQQAQTPGDNAPLRVAVALLEPARVAFSRALRRRVTALRRRSSAVSVLTLPFISRLGRRWNARFIAHRLRQFGGDSSIVLHCRGEAATSWGTAVAAHLPSSAVIADVRGIWSDEMLLARGYRRLADADAVTQQDYRIATARLRSALKDAHAVFAVSNPLAEWLERLGMSPKATLRVPCSVPRITFSPEGRASQRAALGLSDRTVLVYLGGVAPYQHLDQGLVPFARLALAADERVHLLCITNDPVRMQAVLEEGGVALGARTTVMRMAQSDVPNVLAAADAGFLLREPTEVNRVAMPVKAGEYLASGVPLILSRTSGDLDHLVKEYQAGVLVSWFGLGDAARMEEVHRVLSALRSHSDALRAGALALCEERFLWSRHVPAMRRAYVDAARSVRSAGHG